jgi:sortase B
MKMRTKVLSVLLAGLMAFSVAPQIAEPFSVSSVAASKLAAPTNISATIKDTYVKLKWSKVKGASAYRVYMYNAKTKKFVKYKNVTSASCKVTGLKAGNTYRFKIVALVKSNGKYVEQTQSNPQSVTTKLSAPGSFKATVSGTSIKLTWKKVTGAAGYRILLYDSVTKQYKTYKNISGTKFTFKNLPAGTYKFKVAALVKNGKTLKEQVQSSAVSAKLTKGASTATSSAVSAKEHVCGYRYGTKKYTIKHDISYMKSLSTDFIGWLTIKDTPIDIPVVQATDNRFYLTHDFYGAYDPTKVGTTFADYHVKVTAKQTPDNLVVYGHNIRTGVGLAKITNYYPLRYGSLNFYLTHPTISYESAYGGTSTYVVFAGMFVNTDKKHGAVFKYHTAQNFKNESTFYKYFENVFDRSVFYNPDVNIKYGDKFLTLSTCFYPFGADVDTRFVLFARQLRSGESSKISTSNAYVNKSPLYFTYWYKVNGGKWAGRSWPTKLMDGYAAWKKKNS